MSKPLIYVYSYEPFFAIDCVEAVSQVLQNSGQYDVKTIGPSSWPYLPFTTANLSAAKAIVFGGGEGVELWNQSGLSALKPAITDFVSKGGTYIGICMGAYVTAPENFDLLSRNNLQVTEKQRVGCPVKNTKDSVLPITFYSSLSASRQTFVQDVYFQDGCGWIPNNKIKPPATTIVGDVLARYPNNDVAALRTTYGQGKVLCFGPHPEAPNWWFYTTAAPSDTAKFPSAYFNITNRWHDIPPTCQQIFLNAVSSVIS